MDRTSSLVNPTATSISLIAESWIPDDRLPWWRGSTIRDAQDPSSTTCRMAGACTSGWLHRERCSCGLHVDEDAALLRRWWAEESYPIDGSLLPRPLMEGPDKLDCLFKGSLWPKSTLEEYDWQRIIPWEWEHVLVIHGSSLDGSRVCRCIQWRWQEDKYLRARQGALEKVRQDFRLEFNTLILANECC